jgi:hypothetical protein
MERDVMTISPFIYGLHDAGGESNMAPNKGWIVFTEAIGTAGSGGGDYRPWSDSGHGVIVRLNNGYESSGTLPFESEYSAFAQRCASYVQGSSGVDDWIIGNEPNSPREWPGNVDGSPQTGQPITAARYAACYRACRAAIRQVAPGARVCPAGQGTWGPPLPAQGIGGFIDHWREILIAIGAADIDGLILHAYTHGCDPAMATSETMMADPPYQNIHLHFRVYRDYMAAIPADMRSKAVLITECNQNIEAATGNDPKHAWRNQNIGWVRAIYREIDDWNRANNQKIQCVALFRWPLAREGDYTYGLSDKDQVLADFREAVGFGYRWSTSGGGTGALVAGTPTGTNLGREATRAAADSEFDANYGAAKAKDGTPSSKWCSGSAPPPHWLAYDLGSSRPVRGFIVRHAGAGGEPSYFNTKRFTLQSSASFDGPWTDEGSADNAGQANVTSLVYTSGPKTLRYVRLRVDEPGPDNYARIPEFEVWGDAAVTPSSVGVDFEVPYVHQLWDTEIDGFDGAPACGPTSAVMVLAAMQRLSPRPTQVPRPSPHTNDWGFYVSKSYAVEPRFSGAYTFDESQPDGSNHLGRGAYGACVIDRMAYAYKIYQYLERHDVGYRYEDTAARITPENLRRELDGGALIILATYIAGDPGHLIVLRGYDSRGDFIVNDPRGNYGSNGWTGSGERVTYTWQKILGPENRTPLYYIAAYGPQYLARVAGLALAVHNAGPASGTLDIRFLTSSGGLDASETRALASGASATLSPRASSFSGSAVILPRQTGLGALAVELGSNANLDNLGQAIGLDSLAGFGRIARKLYLPTVFSRIWGYDTSIRILNAGLAITNDVRVRLLGRAGYGDAETSFSLAPGSSVELALPSLIGVNAWVGTAVISASQALAVASRDVDTSGASRTSSGVSKGAATLYAPVVYRESYGLSSGVVVQNLGESASEIDVELRDRDGALRHTHALGSIGPLRAAGVFLPSLDISLVPAGWAGTAVIRSRNGQPMAAQVSARKPSAGVAAYNAVTAGSQRFVIPRVVKAIQGRSTSFLMLSTDAAMSVEARYLDASGGTALVAQYAIAARGGVGQFVGSETRLVDGWSGAIVLTASAACLAVVVREDSATTISSANALPR